MTVDVELWLYGSRARGDSDALSDTDLLVVGDQGVDIAPAIDELDYPRISPSFYSWDEVERMAAYGSLFLRHVAAEGERLRASTTAPRRLPALLANLPAFSRSRQDLSGFRRALAESRASLRDGGWPDFECEVVATVARHAAILGAYCVGEAAFGRERPFHIAGAALGYAPAEVALLAGPATAWRLHQPGAHTAQSAINAWLGLVGRFLDDLEAVIDDYTALLPQAA